MGLKKMFKKNQLMITALALMIAVAGYLHFSGDVKDQITISDEQAAAQADETQTTEAANLMEYDVEDTFTAEGPSSKAVKFPIINNIDAGNSNITE